MLNTARWRSMNAPIQGRANWPATNGTNNCSVMSRSALPGAMPAPCVWISAATSSGVSTMPIRLENDALHTAARTLPRAIDVNAIDDCTVAGNVHRNSMPSASCGPTSAFVIGCRARPNSGNSANVHRNTSRCRRQCVMPAITASRDSFAPCMKNSSAIASFVMPAKITAASPRHGAMLASTTVTITAIVKPSNSRVRRSFTARDFAWERISSDYAAGGAGLSPAACLDCREPSRVMENADDHGLRFQGDDDRRRRAVAGCLQGQGDADRQRRQQVRLHAAVQGTGGAL